MVYFLYKKIMYRPFNDTSIAVSTSFHTILGIKFIKFNDYIGFISQEMGFIRSDLVYISFLWFGLFVRRLLLRPTSNWVYQLGDIASQNILFYCNTIPSTQHIFYKKMFYNTPHISLICNTTRYFYVCTYTP